MTAKTKKWVLANMRFVALQIADTPGNIVLFCQNGRSRSPMYLVAYLVVSFSMQVNDAIAHITELLQFQRGQKLDRFNSLTAAIEHIYNGTSVEGSRNRRL